MSETTKSKTSSSSNDEACLNLDLISPSSTSSGSFPISMVRSRSNSLLAHSVDPSYHPKLLKKYGSLSSPSSIDVEDIQGLAKVLVLHTGGTIGMKANKDGDYEPLTSGSFLPELKRLPMFHDGEFEEELPEDSLVLTRNKGTPIMYSIYEYDPVLDSCNMTMDDWKMLAKDIERNYQKFDGFVITHGTDTMAYTASALAFMLENLGKPVILTGAQIPIFEPRSDGRDNLLGALIIAGQYMIPEVCLYFNDTLLRGCRSTKIDNESFAAFSSPNVSRPLAHVGIEITVHWNDVFKPYSTEKFSISTSLSQHVGVLRLFPSISVQTVHLFLQSPMQGVVIQSFGAGNGPSARKDLFKELKDATDRGVIIVNITQCSRGAVKRSYETGAALLQAGIIAGADMTPEAALTKLSYVIGKDVSLEEKKEMMMQNLRGELRTAPTEKLTMSSNSLVVKVAQAMSISSGREYGMIRDVLYPSMMCSAAQKGDLTSLQEFISTGGNISAQSDYDGRSPLHVAASEGNVVIVQFLLKNGASVHTRDRNGDTPLNNAVHFAHEEVVRILVQTGAHLSVSKSKIGSLLYNAALDERIDQLRCWRLAGVDLNSTNQEGRTILHAAASIGSLVVAEWLVRQDLDLCVLDNQGQMPVELAENAGHADVAAVIRTAISEKES